jgi:hypothetical protein
MRAAFVGLSRVQLLERIRDSGDEQDITSHHLNQLVSRANQEEH